MKNNLIPVFAIASIFFVSCSITANKNAGEIPEKILQPVAIENTKPVTYILPALKLMTTDGSIINLTNLKGKKVFINPWATWCPPCKAEIPSIEKLYNKVAKENTVFVMLSLDEDFEMAKSFAMDNKMNLPVYYPAENLPAMFNTEGIPATFIFNEKGELIKMNSGMDDYDTEDYVQLLKAKNLHIPKWIEQSTQNADVLFGGAEDMLNPFTMQYPGKLIASTREKRKFDKQISISSNWTIHQSITLIFLNVCHKHS